MTGIGERLAILETKVEQGIEESHDRAETQQAILDELRSLAETVNDVQSQMTHYKGFFGGVVFMASSLGVFLYKCGYPLYEYLIKIKTG